MFARRPVKRQGLHMAEKPSASATADVTETRLAAAAVRALAEAEERRKAGKNGALPAEKGGQPGPEPTRYGDWEKKGIICDF